MLKNVDFLFVYDVKNREYDNLCLIAYELRRRGYTVGFQSFWYCTTHRRYPQFQTKVAALATCYKDTVYRTFTAFAGDFEKVVNLQWEQLPPNGTLESESRALWANADWNASGVLQHGVRYVSWGERNRERLENIVGVEPNNICVTGCVTLDFYRPEFRSFMIPREILFKRYHLDPNKRTALFISSFVFVNFPKLNSVSPLMSEAAVDAYKAVSFESQQKILEWIGQALNSSEKNDIQIIYRPHPSEMDNPVLHVMEKRVKGFFVIPNEPIKHWINACDVLYNWNSTSAVEAYYSGKPSYTLRAAPVPHRNQMPVFNNCRFVEDYHEFEETLYYSDDPQVREKYGMNREVLDSFYTLSDTPAYVKVCDFLENTLKDEAFQSPRVQVSPDQVYYRGNMRRIARVIKTHWVQNCVLNPIQYWIAFRLKNAIRYRLPNKALREMRIIKRKGKAFAARVKGNAQKYVEIMAQIASLQEENRQESAQYGQWNQMRRTEAHQIRLQLKTLVKEFCHFAFSEDYRVKRKHDRMKTKEHYVPVSEFEQGIKRIGKALELEKAK